MTARPFFRCLSCGHITPYRAGTLGIVAHNDRLHEGRGRFEQLEPAPGHAALKDRYSDDWEDIDLTGATIDVEFGMFTWGLFITSLDGKQFIHGEWASQRTAENRRLELRKIGRAGQ